MQPYLAMIVPVSNAGEPPRPDNSLPSGGHPSHPIYHPGHPDHGLPSRPDWGARPDQGLPGSGMPSWGGGWGSGDRPDQGLPGQGGHPSHGLPGQGGRPDQGLPGAQPKTSMHAGVPESEIPVHPERPDPDAQGTWILVALGDRTVGWAWMETPTPEAAPK